MKELTKTMKATILSDNIPFGEIESEWGLSIYIEYGDKNILLDAGASDLFLRNSIKLGKSIASVDFAVLSHAHWDHADGMPVFFGLNKKAKLYIQNSCKENCYADKENQKEYIGVPIGLLDEYKDRLEYIKGDYEISEGIYIVSHKTTGLEKCGERSGMYVKEDGKFIYDDFSHEQSLVFETDKGLVIFNSCSHGGADNIIKEVSQTFPGKKLYAIIGGFHLFDKTDEEAAKLAESIKKTGISKVYTGHCTGERAMEIIKNSLGDMAEQFHAGLVMEF